MGLVIRKPGVLTTVQDGGRFGHQASGFSTNGAMDSLALNKANLLLDNSPNDPALEFVLAGPKLRFTTNTIFSLSGADFHAKLNDAPVERYRAIFAKRGSILEMSAPIEGTYGYLAVAGGGVLVPKIMGSSSTNLKCNFGGFKGRKLKIGDYVETTTTKTDFIPYYESRKIENDDEFYGFGKETIEIRVVLGPQDEMFSATGIATFFGNSYKMTGKCDRMGYRLAGPVVETKAGSDIISEGISLGAIQIPNDGNPIVMMADRQTTGGYAKIANVASVDLPKLTQRSQGKQVHFSPIGVEEAQQLLFERREMFINLKYKIHRPTIGCVSPRRTARRLTPILKQQAEINNQKKLWIEQFSINARTSQKNNLERVYK